MKILVTGTPGVGKTTLSALICKHFGLDHVDLSNFIKENHLYESYDDEFDTRIFDSAKVKKSLKEYLSEKSGYVIDTHSPDLADFVSFDIILLIKLDNQVLYQRLKERNYSDKKIEENIQCEIFDEIAEIIDDCFEQEHFLVDGSNYKFEDVVMLIEKNKKRSE